MVLSRRRFLLEVERLENRLTPAASVLDTPLVVDPPSDTTDASVITPIDPTGDPVNSGNTTVVATVTGVETPTSNELVFSITVSGLTPQNVQPLSTISFTVPSGATYTVDAAFQQENGDYALVVLGGVDTTGLDVGSTLVITIGNGGEIVTTPPGDPPPDDPSDPPPTIPPIDPTGDPTGADTSDSGTDSSPPADDSAGKDQGNTAGSDVGDSGAAPGGDTPADDSTPPSDDAVGQDAVNTDGSDVGDSGAAPGSDTTADDSTPPPDETTPPPDDSNGSSDAPADPDDMLAA